MAQPKWESAPSTHANLLCSRFCVAINCYISPNLVWCGMLVMKEELPESFLADFVNPTTREKYTLQFPFGLESVSTKVTLKRS